MKRFFADTNLFLECRAACDLPFQELPGVSQSDEIELVPPAQVVIEIERHKSKGNSRAAKRARKASALLRRALDNPDHRVAVRDANPRITLVIPPPTKVDFPSFPNLDPARPDHQIAVEYALRAKDDPELLALSDGTLLVVALHSLGFHPAQVPDSWKLAPEKDERDDKIDKLQEELRRLKQTIPEISVSFAGADDLDIKSLTADIEEFRPSSSDYDRIAAALILQHPEVIDFEKKPPSETVPAIAFALWASNMRLAPNEREIAEYKHQYRRWAEDLRRTLPSVARTLNEIAREVPFSISVSNTGYVNGSGVRMTITGLDGVMLLDGIDEDEKEDRQRELLLPQLPSAPRGRFFDMLWGYDCGKKGNYRGALRDYLGTPRPRDPNQFYRVGGWSRKPVSKIELSCEALPHQVGPYVRQFRAVVREQLGSQPRLHVRIHASNMREPIEQYLPVTVRTTLGDFERKLADIQFKGEWTKPRR